MPFPRGKGNGRGMAWASEAPHAGLISTVGHSPLCQQSRGSCRAAPLCVTQPGSSRGTAPSCPSLGTVSPATHQGGGKGEHHHSNPLLLEHLSSKPGYSELQGLALRIRLRSDTAFPCTCSLPYCPFKYKRERSSPPGLVQKWKVNLQLQPSSFI